MNRAFSIQFHNNFPDKKPIVTFSVRVNHGGRFKKLDNEGKENLLSNLKAFKKSLEGFEKEIEKSIDN